MPTRAKHLVASLAIVVLLLLAVTPIRAQSNYVHGNGTTLALGGTTFTPRGVNLGNWFVPEPYMFGGGSSDEQLRTALITLAGSTANYQAWRASYLSNYVTQADVQRLQSAGFNTVRVPLDWRDFVDANGAAVSTGLYGATLPANAPFGLAYIDNLLNWCTAAGVYVLLDMHVTPSTVDNNTEIYVTSTSQDSSTLDQVKAAWTTISQRYPSATNLLGYDLLNEPPGSINSEYRPTYQQIRTAIRTHDKNHLLVVESNVDADLGDTIDGNGYLGAPIDSNMAVSIHSYGDDTLPPASIDADYPTSANNYNGRAYYAWEYANKENVPVLIGETGENNNNWINAIVHLWLVGKVGSAGQPITAGVLYWTYKKPGDSVRAVVSVPFTANWSTVENYLNNGGSVPAEALNTLMSQASLSSYGNETWHPDVADALLRDYHVSNPRPFPSTVPSIPGTINAASFDMGLASPDAVPGSYSGYAYHSANSQTLTYQVRDDVVGTYLLNSNTVVGDNNAGDWQNYTVNVAPGNYQILLDYTAASAGAQISLALNDGSFFTTSSLAATGGSSQFQEQSVGTAPIAANGQATLRVTTVVAGLDYAYVRFAQLAPSTPTGLSGVAADRSLVLKWSVSDSATSYVVTYGTGGTSASKSASGPPFTLAGLMPGTTYSVTISAVNGAGTSAPTSSLLITTLSELQQWKLTYYGTTTIPDTATPDGDNLPILLKYATGLTPGSPATNPVSLLSGGSNLGIKFTRLNPATITYVVQASNDLNNWTPIATLSAGNSQWSGPGTVSETALDGSTSSVTVTDVTTVSSLTRRFLRLQVTDPGM